jgi:hypothetical protein
MDFSCSHERKEKICEIMAVSAPIKGNIHSILVLHFEPASALKFFNRVRIIKRLGLAFDGITIGKILMAVFI